jgi:hypothetical protein
MSTRRSALPIGGVVKTFCQKGVKFLEYFQKRHIPLIISTAKIQFVAPYCQSRFHAEPKLAKELSDDYEKRTWKKRLHVDDGGNIIIPGMAFSNCIKEAAKFLGLQIPGKGKMTWTKQFEAGISVVEDISTGFAVDDAIEKRMFVPSTGIRGDGKRVMKSYPILLPGPKPFVIDVPFVLTNDMITPEVFTQHLVQAGQLIGLGSFRVRNNGIFGRFKVLEVNWQEQSNTFALPKINITKSEG